jgi:threonylcarbamoyladenosine tRNA methylthiotransferase MtaB
MKFYLFSLGCKVNVYENSSLRENFLKAGYEEVKKPEDADVIVLNTCAVTGVAEAKSRQHIRKFKKLSPHCILVVMGCYSEIHAEVAIEAGAEIVLGTNHRDEIPTLIKRYQSEKKTLNLVSKSGVRHEKYEEMGPMALTSQTRAVLKIQDGCDNFCSYCLIPTLRGNSRSRDPNSSILEASRLVENGYKEIVIGGIHIGAYGKDLNDGKYRLANLLSDMIKENPTLYRLRISSIEESEISDELLDLYAQSKVIASHFHIPLQSGSSSVLKRMKRHYDTAAFLSKLERIRAIRPETAITTDIIVGFPGESDEEWQETLDFARQASFAEIHVFPFSSREGTLAASLPNQITPDVKEKRVQELLALSKELRHNYEKKFYGQKVEVLYEEYDSKLHLAKGHTSNYLLVATPSLSSKHGQIEEVVYNEKVAAD